WLFPPSRKIKAYLDNNANATTSSDVKYRQILRKGGEKLRKAMGPFWKQTQDSLREINSYANDRGIRLGCENREKFEELPLDDDFPSLFEAMGEGTACGYWHDTGHANIKASMGVINHHDHLAQNAHRLL